MFRAFPEHSGAALGTMLLAAGNAFPVGSACVAFRTDALAATSHFMFAFKSNHLFSFGVCAPSG